MLAAPNFCVTTLAPRLHCRLMKMSRYYAIWGCSVLRAAVPRIPPLLTQAQAYTGALALTTSVMKVGWRPQWMGDCRPRRHRGLVRVGQQGYISRPACTAVRIAAQPVQTLTCLSDIFIDGSFGQGALWFDLAGRLYSHTIISAKGAVLCMLRCMGGGCNYYEARPCLPRGGSLRHNVNRVNQVGLSSGGMRHSRGLSHRLLPSSISL